MAGLLKASFLFVGIILIGFSQSAISAPSTSSEDRGCLAEFEKLINDERVPVLLESLANSIGVPEEDVPDAPFKASIPGVIDVKGSYAGVKLFVKPGKIESLRFDAKAFKLSVVLVNDLQRVEGSKYEIEGSVGRIEVAGSGGPFHAQVLSSNVSLEVFFENEGFTCSVPVYQIRDLKVGFELGEASLSFPGLSINGKVVDWEELSKEFGTKVEEQWEKSRDYVTSKVKEVVNKALLEFPISPELINTLLP